MELLDVIDERDASILRLRFGLQGEQPLTLKEIGDARIGLTRERVRQLESEALGRIRRPSNLDIPSVGLKNAANSVRVDLTDVPQDRL